MTPTTVRTSRATRPTERPDRPRRAVGLTFGLAALSVALAAAIILSITLGTRDITVAVIFEAFADYNPADRAHTVIREMRVPRTLLGVLAGAALGISGTILQGATRNPLADPGIMGINAGAAAFMVTGVLLFGVQTVAVTVWFAFAGAGFATACVYAIASFGREGATPVKLALAGAAITAGLTAVTSGIAMTNVNALNELRFWQVGALTGRYMPVIVQTAPFIVAALAVALFTGRALNGLALGDDIARGLGQRVHLNRTLLFATVAVLCGAATAAIGPIVFLGLIAPHIARIFCGPDYRWILAYAVVLTPLILLICDIIGRLAGAEVQVGVVIGVLGAPFFIALVRFGRLSEL